MIRVIEFNETILWEYKVLGKNEEKKTTLNNLSKINIFIGENNSGKSRLMRNIFARNSSAFRGVLNSEIDYMIEDFKYSSLKKIQDEEYKIINDFSQLYPKIRYDGHREVVNIFTYLRNFKLSINDFDNYNYKTEDDIKNICNEIYNDVLKLSQDTVKHNYDNEISFERFYIPMLRGLKPIERNITEKSLLDCYQHRTKKDYFDFNNDHNFHKRIFTGLGLYEDCKNLLLGAKEDRDKIRKFEEFLSECFFDGKEVNLIPSIKDDVLHVRIGSEEYAVSQLGDGIQSVIILTYPLFFNQGKNMLFFFEEPEQCLHPAYQRVFMETLMRKEFDTFQYFFTTHSNHLLDITLDIDKVSIYTFKKTNDSMDNPTFEIENVDNENTDILRLIGVRNSSVFLSNCTIWVEGITDRIYIRKYLEVFQKTQNIKFLEDIHYSFVEYGGGNITHWSFLEDADPNHSNILVDRLCGKLFLITDQDGAGKKKDGTADEGSSEKKAKYDRHIKLKEKLGENHYHCLEAREIENLLSTEILRETIKMYEKNNADEIVFSEKFLYENYKHELLGKFIDKYVENTKRKSYAADSGTINDKLQFAKRAVENIEKLSDLSEEAKELTGKLYDFIKEQNGDKGKSNKI